MKGLKEQLKTKYKKDAEDCIEIYDALKSLDNGSVWSSKWVILVNAIYEGFPSDKRRYKPTNIGYIFLKGLKVNN